MSQQKNTGQFFAQVAGFGTGYLVFTLILHTILLLTQRISTTTPIIHTGMVTMIVTLIGYRLNRWLA